VRPPSRALTRLIALTLLGSAIPALSLAQDFERVTPKLPTAGPPPDVPTPVEAEPVSRDQTVLVPELKGVVFVDAPGAVQTSGLGPETVPDGVAVQGFPLLQDPAFLARVKALVGKPLTRADLDALVRLVRAQYRLSGHPFMDVVAPPQNVQRGVVQIVVTEYRLGQVEVTGNQHFSDSLILRLGGLRTGEVLSLPRLREALDDYNRNPFLAVSAVAEPGATTGQTDVVLHVEDRAPYRAYAGYDNQGARTLGRDEWYAGFNLGNLWGQGHILSYQYTRSFSGRYTSNSISDVIPIDRDNRIWVFGAYATQRPDIGDLFDSKGHSSQVSARYIRDLPRFSPMTQSLQIGVDYKRTDNDLEFLGFRLLETAVVIVQIPITYTLSAADRHGQTVVENLLVVSPGDITRYNDDASFRMLVPYGDANYYYDRLSVTRTTLLPREMTWIVRGMVQGASDNLPFSEQISAGGIGAVRGYDPNIVLGSQGVVLSTELRTKSFGVLPQIDDRMQLGLFLDYADVSQRTPFPDLPDGATLASVGFNVHYDINRYFNLQLEVGSQLRRAPGADDRDTRVAVITTLSF
jgi:hemolysin activation/secretion protein